MKPTKLNFAQVRVDPAVFGADGTCGRYLVIFVPKKDEAPSHHRIFLDANEFGQQRMDVSNVDLDPVLNVQCLQGLEEAQARAQDLENLLCDD